MKTKEINKCSECGSEAKSKVTIGGPNFYYAIHCTKCNNNSRGMGNLLPQLFSEPSPHTPQRTKDEAVNVWNKANAPLPTILKDERTKNLQ